MHKKQKNSTYGTRYIAKRPLTSKKTQGLRGTVKTANKCNIVKHDSNEQTKVNVFLKSKFQQRPTKSKTRFRTDKNSTCERNYGIRDVNLNGDYWADKQHDG